MHTYFATFGCNCHGRVAGDVGSVSRTNTHVCITTAYTKSNPNPNHTAKQHAVVNIQLNIVTCPTYPDKFLRDMLLHRLCDQM